MTATVAFRVDASPQGGGGHVMRCLALAEALRALGARCLFLSARGSAETVPALSASGHDAIALDPDEDPLERLSGPLDWLVVDHYGLDARFERAARQVADRIMVIDDLADRPHDCDLLLDQTPGRTEESYRALATSGCKLLMGPGFALLRPGFVAGREAALRRRSLPAPAKRLLIACGSSDPADLTGKALAAADGLDLEVTAVLGAAAPHLEAVRARCGRLLVEPDDMAGLMAEADLAIGAGGTSSLERCCLGLPSLIAVIADNQAGNAAALSARGAAVDLGPAAALSTDAIAAALTALAGDGEARRTMARSAASLCDGLGARRTAMHLIPERARNGRPVVLRKADAEDSATMLAWQQEPSVRRWARSPAPPGLEEHEAWMAAKLADPGCLLNLIECAGQAVGVLRLDRLDPGTDDTERHEVSILVAPGLQGHGLGRAALALARRLLPGVELVAEVKPDNSASHALFRGAGYSRTAEGYVSRPDAGIARSAEVVAIR